MEASPGKYSLNCNFHVKSNYVAPKEYKVVDKFCFRVRDKLRKSREKSTGQVDKN